MDHCASGRTLVLSVRNADTIRDVKRQYARQAGILQSDIHISFREDTMKDDDPLHKYGIASGKLSLMSLGTREHQFRAADLSITKSQDGIPMIPRPICLAAAATESFDHETITVVSAKSGYPDLSFQTIRLSCESHAHTRGEKNYAGFILYGWEDEGGRMQTDWRLNGKHCKSAYLVVQGTDSEGVKKCRRAGAPGQVHGAIYWNVFGIGSKVDKAVGEGFALIDGIYKWNSITFNANHDAYHDNRRVISRLAKKCVRNILDDWQRSNQLGKTYSVKDLLSKD